jgi:hypothetical protein
VRLSHWSRESIAEVSSHDQQKSTRPYGKPRGLWVSVDGDDDWAWWCDAEQFCDLSQLLRYEVVLAPDANLLLLDSVEAVLSFTREHGRTATWNPALFSADGTAVDYVDYIDWARVARAYQGIVIAPYQWSLRLESITSWYYPWDCASGCIWDAAAIKELRDWAP